MKKLLILFLICLLLPLCGDAVTYGLTGESTNFTGDVNVPSGSNYYINGVQITSDALSDVASIAMLDEAETVTGGWTFTGPFTFEKASDTPSVSPSIHMIKKRDGDPTYDVSDEDDLGFIEFIGWSDAEIYGALIMATVDGTPGAGDMPTRLEFYTTPDDSDTLVLRLAIDNAGNVKIGDGAWTNYFNVDSGGVVTFEGTANIEGVDATELGYVDGVTEDIQTALDTILANIVEDTTPELGGELDAGAHSIGFTMGTATGDGTTTIDWTASNKFEFTHGAMAETFTFDPAPTNPCSLTLKIIQDGVGSRDCTWPATVKWLGTEPTWTDGGAGKVIIMGMFWDGTDYWSQGTPWES